MALNHQTGESQAPMDHPNVKEVIRSLLAAQETVANRHVSTAVGLTPQAVHYHLSAMVGDGELVVEGAGRGTRYRLATVHRAEYDTDGLEEDAVWVEARRHLPSDLSGEAFGVLRYAVTEMVNNVIDHSASETAEIMILQRSDRIVIRVKDLGVGIFRHLRDHRGFSDNLSAIEALAKGKYTTQPTRHSGEGIFFTSKAVARFIIDSGTTRWIVDNERGDQAVGSSPVGVGTVVTLEVDPATNITLQSLFRDYTDDEFRFTRTRLDLGLFEAGTDFVSRSEAKRVTEGLDRFSEVIIDFSGVATVGQGFADELFRVWQRDHPETRLQPIGMNRDVELLIQRAIAARGEAEQSRPSGDITTASSGVLEYVSWDERERGR